MPDRVDPAPYVRPTPHPRPWHVSLYATPNSTASQGVGTIIKIHFDQDIPERARWTITSKMRLSSTDPQQDLTAPWVWLDGATMAWRPNGFWRGHQTVTVRSTWGIKNWLMLFPAKDGSRPKRVLSDLDSRYGLTLTDRVRLTINIGADQRFLVDANTHEGVVKRDGETVRRVPVSLGMPGWETYSGVKTFMEAYEEKRLYNPGQWDVTVPYAIRLTLSGEFLHSAPWNGSIGSANLSHGCTNLTIDDARWMYENIQYGDPAIYVNGVGEPPLWDGDGAGWNLSWAQWRAMAAPRP